MAGVVLFGPLIVVARAFRFADIPAICTLIRSAGSEKTHMNSGPPIFDEISLALCTAPSAHRQA
jgi:hypothetical protein